MDELPLKPPPPDDPPELDPALKPAAASFSIATPPPLPPPMAARVWAEAPCSPRPPPPPPADGDGSWRSFPKPPTKTGDAPLPARRLDDGLEVVSSASFVHEESKP